MHIRCGAWDKKLSDEQIMYAAMDAVAGALIDYIILATPCSLDSTRYSPVSTPPIGMHVLFICGSNAPHEPAIVGMRGTVQDNDAPIVSGPHFHSNPAKRYNPTASARRRLVKVLVVNTTTSLCTLPHPRASILCSSVSVGEILWLPINKLRPANSQPEDELSFDQDATDFHQEDEVSNVQDRPDQAQSTNSDSDSDHEEMMPDIDSFTLLPVPTGEVERHLEEVWETLANQLDQISVTDDTRQFHAVRRVQGDVFHMMKRPRPAAKHSFLDMYAQALSYAFFLRDEDDEQRVYTALRRRDFCNQEIRRLLLKDYNYTMLRIRRRLRPPRILVAWLDAIFTAFGPLRCSKTKKTLLSRKEQAKAKNVLDEVRDGFVSDVHGVELYQALYTPNGTEWRDRDYLPLRSCARGSNNTENMHQKLIGSMNNMWNAGQRTTSALLVLTCHRHNDKELCTRAPNHEYTGHINVVLSSHIWKVCVLKSLTKTFMIKHSLFLLLLHLLQYEEIAYPQHSVTRSNPNILDFKWIPLPQMFAPTNQDAYNVLLANRMQKATQAAPGLFGSPGGCFVEGANYIASYQGLFQRFTVIFPHTKKMERGPVYEPRRTCCVTGFLYSTKLDVTVRPFQHTKKGTCSTG